MENDYQIRTITRMFEEVTRSIIEYIQEEQLEKGAKLPPERTLSELLEVSRSSVREGLRILELLNYLESRQGGGTFVAEPSPFIIPYRIIKQNIDQSTLKKYFEIALLNAEKIIILSMEHSIVINLTQIEKTFFWSEFSAWINVLGNQLENDYYLNLWNIIYPLLIEHDYLQKMTVTHDVNDLKIAFCKKDKQVFTEFFSNH